MNLNLLLGRGGLSLHSVTEAGELLFLSEYYQYFSIILTTECKGWMDYLKLLYPMITLFQYKGCTFSYHLYLCRILYKLVNIFSCWDLRFVQQCWWKSILLVYDAVSICKSYWLFRGSCHFHQTPPKCLTLFTSQDNFVSWKTGIFYSFFCSFPSAISFSALTT